MQSDPLIHLPEAAVIRQSLYSRPISDPADALKKALSNAQGRLAAKDGRSVAVAVGSRRIDRIQEVLFHCLRILEARGMRPFIVPAMGSHGGATAEGQKEVLKSLGITERRMKAPIIGDMETRPAGSINAGPALFTSRAALDADHIVLINRIKPHTKFNAPVESGLCKMLTIGLGKKEGAAEFHRKAVASGFRIIETAAAELLGRLPLLLGIGLLEDGRGRLSEIAVLLPEDLIEKEKELLSRARAGMGTIPFDRLDILIVDRIGKDISGIGMDSNVTGRHRDIVGDFDASPHVKRIFVRDLSAAAHGNANGIGLADFTTCRLVEKIDRKKTFVNALTAISPEKAAIPIHFETDRECVRACAETCGQAESRDLRIVRIRDTASLEYLQVSRPLEPEFRGRAGIEQVTSWEPFCFDDAGSLRDFLPCR
jgi:hypothetical protein